MLKTPAKIAAASRGPRQSSTARSPAQFSDMVQQLPLALAVVGHCHWRQHMRAVPNAIKHAEAAAQRLGNFCARLKRCLRATSPPARELIEILAVGAGTS